MPSPNWKGYKREEKEMACRYEFCKTKPTSPFISQLCEIRVAKDHGW
jgi:hypothetical protein